jgi:hypothetical protein
MVEEEMEALRDWEGREAGDIGTLEWEWPREGFLDLVMDRARGLVDLLVVLVEPLPLRTFCLGFAIGRWPLS